MIKLDETKPISQQDFADLVGIGQPAVSALVKRGILRKGDSAGQWLLAYCEKLRNQATARIESGDLDLAGERTALARVQKERIAMQNADTHRYLAPVTLLEFALREVGKKIAVVLDAIPENISRHSSKMTSADIGFITAEIGKAKAVALGAKLYMRSLGDFPEGAEIDAEGIEEV